VENTSKSQLAPDTIIKYISAESNTRAEKTNALPKINTTPSAAPKTKTALPNVNIGIRTLNPNDLKSASQNHNGRSKEEDHLAKLFTFARI
jgi:hypothetical protein